MLQTRLSLLLGLPLLVACSASGEGSSGPGGAGATGSGATGSGASATSGDDLGFVQPTPGSSAVDDACQAVVQKAERMNGMADVIFALDNSGSMTEEAAAVQNNMNAFSLQVGSAGVDMHVVVISSGPPSAQAAGCSDPLDPNCWANIGGGGDNGVCIEPPLGLAGVCPDGDDTNLAAGYMHWREMVDSNDSLAKIQSTFHGWRSMLRPEAPKTFVVVTDDESQAPPTPQEFSAWVDSQPEFASALWRFSGIFCVTDGANCDGVGNNYSGLVQQTQGVSGNLALFAAGQADAEFARVFDTLAQAVLRDSVPVDCEWTIPPPPEGQTLDPNAVNVRFTSGAGDAQLLYGLDGAAECATAGGGWFYDDPARPGRVIACPSSCEVMQGDERGMVEVLFGCERERPPVM